MTGLIYVVIIALWAAVLIPIWLRRHDQISEVRSTARFSSAMKSLGKNEKSGRSARRGSSSGRPTSPAQEAAQASGRGDGHPQRCLGGGARLGRGRARPRLAPIVLAVVVLTYVIAASMTSLPALGRGGSSLDGGR